jgi:hypothetical protein
MKNTNEMSLETIVVTVLNVVEIGVLTVMVFASLFTAVITHVLVSKITAAKEKTEEWISDTLGVMGVAMISSIAVLTLLTVRFNLPQALGISLLSGILTAFLRHLFTLP